MVSVRMSTSKPEQTVKLLSRVEVIDLVGVSYPCLFGWIREGKLNPAGRAISDTASAAR